MYPEDSEHVALSVAKKYLLNTFLCIELADGTNNDVYILWPGHFWVREVASLH
jgi:hypothetical protein